MFDKTKVMFDKIETLGKSTVQHGPNNDRVYLMKLHPDDKDSIVEQLDNLAILKRYTKISAKVPAWAEPVFRDREYRLEARVPGLFNGREDGCFMAYFFGARRPFQSREEQERIEEIKRKAGAPYDMSGARLPEGYTLRVLDAPDLGALARLYESLFEVYPFPIFNEPYLLSTMRSHVRYYGVFFEDMLVAASSAEMDRSAANAEMTDFATLPGHQGQNLSWFLLGAMARDMEAEGIRTMYTIARARVPGMNRTFAKHGFRLAGTLVNNTLIGASIESMNVWYKQINKEVHGKKEL
jgi:putative beta-lysine N-acetyltransferase